MKNNKVKKNLSRKIFILLIIFWHLISQLSDPLASKANDQIKEDIHLLDRSISSSKIGLFAKTGYGEHYTLYPDGLEKEDAFIGGFKSTQLDPAEENIYFYDSSGKVISKININNGNVYKVLGKPKSTTNIGYTSPVNFDSASLGNLIDFSFDKFGNIFILDNYSSDPNNQNPRILKASLKESAIKEVLRINDLYKSAFKHGNSYDFSFRLDGISYGFDDLFYLYGKCNYARNGYGVYHWDSPGESVVILRFNPLTNSVEFFGSSPDLKKLGINPKVILNPNNSQYFILKGIAFDKSGILYLSTRDNINSSWRQELTKVGPGLNPDGTLVQEAFVSSLNNISDSSNDIGDGGLAQSAFATLTGSKCICGDKTGDLYIADNSNNRIRKILKESGYITTVAGGGNETISFNELKSLKSIALKSPNSLLVDKHNNLFITEPDRILLIKDLVQHEDNPSQEIKVANLEITKIAGQEVKNPKGEINTPDLNLDYTFAGDQEIEVKGKYIPDGTNIKLVSINGDGTQVSNLSSAKIKNNIVNIPLRIDAGTTKVIKAETDPFIPAPNVYLSGTEPKVISNSISEEPANLTPKRDEVNSVTKDAQGALVQNLIPLSARFNFSEQSGWQSAQYLFYWAGNNIKTNLNNALDPDSLGSDSNLVEFGGKQDTLFLNGIQNPWTKVTFSIWMRTDSGNINVPIGIGPYCNRNDWTGCSHLGALVTQQSVSTTDTAVTTANVTPAWQKFTVTNNTGIGSVFIGGLGQTTNQKIYAWGARVEKSQ